VARNIAKPWGQIKAVLLWFRCRVLVSDSIKTNSQSAQCSQSHHILLCQHRMIVTN